MVFEVFIMPFLLLLQTEIKNVKKENESKVTHSEEIYSTLDDVLGGEYLLAIHKQKIRFLCVMS